VTIVSGAAHDAIYVGRVAPAAMIFVPCKDGISHNEIEDARPEHPRGGCETCCSMPSSGEQDPSRLDAVQFK
jgi:acetylornithine deacetylase/succinyl-diaminopimelate desuccinylase-like protein